jgi:putative hemolysin
MNGVTKLSYASPDDPLLKTLLIQSIERLTGQRKLQNLYNQVLAKPETSFWENALAQLQIKLDYEEVQVAKIPLTGPIIFIANHPYGLIDGLAVCHLAANLRQSFKILIHSALCREERIASYLLPIDFSETEAATLLNISSKKQALETLRQGGAIVIFPAGGISTAKGPFGEVTDLDWKLFTAKLIQMTQATVVPIYFHGQNSRLFQIVSQFSLTLRLSLIIHEVNKKRGETIRMIIGDPIPYQRLAPIKKRQALIDYLREVIYSLPKGETEILPETEKTLN